MADSSTDIIIMGAGIAGLAAGCYAQMNGDRSLTRSVQTIMSQHQLNSILEMLQDFSWGDTLSEMRSNFDSGFSMPPYPTAESNFIM